MIINNIIKTDALKIILLHRYSLHTVCAFNGKNVVLNIKRRR